MAGNGFHERAPGRGRELRRALGLQAAAEQIGVIKPGCELFGVTKAFSLPDAIEHILRQIGPADVTVSTWTASGADLSYAAGLLKSGAIQTLRFVVDFSFQARQPAYLASLRQKFGDGAVRITKSHCKFCLLRNGGWNIVVLTSANWNENRSLENYQISDDAGLAEYLEGIVRDLFAFQEPGEAFRKRPIELCRDFEKFGEPGAVAHGAPVTNSTDTRKYFSDKPYENDLNRAGLTRGR